MRLRAEGIEVHAHHGKIVLGPDTYGGFDATALQKFREATLPLLSSLQMTAEELLRQGEILGFYGLVGAGRSEFMQSLFGITRPSSGRIRIDGAAREIASPADAVGAGIVYVPEDRGQQGAITAMPIFQNVTLPSLGRTSRSGFIRLAEEFKLARTYCERLDLRAASLDTDVGNLSGGNQQKVVLSKWLFSEPEVLILDEPTRGIDVGAKFEIYNIINSLSEQGKGVVMISSEMPELLGMCDRIYVMNEGALVGELSAAEASQERIMSMIVTDVVDEPAMGAAE